MTNFRVATFNVESLGDQSEAVASLPDRIAVLRPQLLRLKADILCLQEVDADEGQGGGRQLRALDGMLAATPYQDFFRTTSTSMHGSYPADRHNLVVLSRFPIDRHLQIWHDIVAPLPYTPITAEPRATSPVEVRFDRPLLYVRMVLPDGQRLHVLNLHLRAPLAAPIAGQKQSPLTWRSTQGWAEGYFLAAAKRAGQALEARLFVDRLLDEDPGSPIAVCGDLNAGEDEVPVRLLLGSCDDTNNEALSARALTALESTLPVARRYSVLHAGRQVMLDHMLTSAVLAAAMTRIEIHNEGLTDEVLSHPESRRPAESFHAPVVAEFCLSGQQETRR